MKILIKPREVVVSFSPDNYFICKCKDAMLGDFVLQHRIDRSEKGKDDDLGMEVLYLSKNDAEQFRKVGFMEII